MRHIEIDTIAVRPDKDGKLLATIRYTLPLDALEIIEMPGMNEYRKHKIRRTWRERLFSRPWQPLQKTRIEIECTPRDGLFLVNGEMAYGHSTMVARFRERRDLWKEMFK